MCRWRVFRFLFGSFSCGIVGTRRNIIVLLIFVMFKFSIRMSIWVIRRGWLLFRLSIGEDVSFVLFRALVFGFDDLGKEIIFFYWVFFYIFGLLGLNVSCRGCKN